MNSLLDRKAAKPLPFVLIAAIVIAFLVVNLHTTRKQELNLAARNAENIASVLDGHLAATFAKIDVALNGAVQELGPLLAEGKSERINPRLAEILGTIPESQSLRIIDARGNPWFDASGKAPSGNIADRAYFVRHRENPGSGLVLSEPIFARFTNNWVVTASRQFRDKEGRFLGIIQAAIRNDYFNTFFRTLNLGKPTIIALTDDKRQLFARYPELPGKTGQKLESPEFARQIDGTSGSGSFIAPSPADGIERIHYFRHVSGGYPFIYIVASEQSQALRHFHRTALIYLVLVALLLGLLWSTLQAWKTLHGRAEKLAEAMSESSKANHQRALALLNGVASPAWLSGSDGRIVSSNTAFETLVGKTAQDIAGRLLSEVCTHAAAAEIESAVVASCREGTMRTVTAVFNIPSATPPARHYQFTISPVATEQSGAQGTAVIANDLTEIMAAARATEEALATVQASLDAKRHFLANMSHEFRTPINGILGMAEVLSMGNSDEDTQLCTREIIGSGRRLLELVNNIMDYVDTSNAAMPPRNAPFALNHTLAQLEADFAETAREHGLMFALHLADNVPEVVNGNEKGILRIVGHYIDNAFKFTERGQVSLTVSDQGDAGEGRRKIRFEVCDTGIGIPESFQPQVFTAFSQASSSLSRTHEGAGVGLAMCRRVAESLGSQVGFASTPGQGSRFWLDIPLEPL